MKLLRMFVQNVLLESRLDVPTIRSMSWKQLLGHASRELRQLGKGSSRVVFLLSSKRVLKLARNDFGLEQNQQEVDLSTDPSVGPIIARVLDYDDKFRWVISELVRPLKGPVEFNALVGFPSWHLMDVAYYGGQLPYDISPGARRWAGVAIEFIKDHRLAPIDSASPTHWGKTPDGRIVLLDYGFVMRGGEWDPFEMKPTRPQDFASDPW